MDTKQIINIVQSIGFPIVMCGAMGWFVFYMFNKNVEQIDKVHETYGKQIQELENTIDNNTIALTKVIEVIKNLKNK